MSANHRPADGDLFHDRDRAEFQALLDRIEAAPAVVERVARAMHAAVCDCGQGPTNIDRKMAAAALREMRS